MSSVAFTRSNYDLTDPDYPHQETVIVKVGFERVSTFVLPKRVLTETSFFFRTRMKKYWSTGEAQIITLKQEDPAVFDLFARWVAFSNCETLLDEKDWIATYTEYLDWQLDLEEEKKKMHHLAEKTPISPALVWDFSLTTKAWFLGDFLQSPDFQNYCLCHLYFMNFRFDHIDFSSLEWTQDDLEQGYWHWDTLAYLNISDILLISSETAGYADNFNRHPLREFLRDWLVRYWDAYNVTCWHTAVHDGIDELMEAEPDLMKDVMKGLMANKTFRRWDALKCIQWYMVPKLEPALEDRESLHDERDDNDQKAFFCHHRRESLDWDALAEAEALTTFRN